MPAGRPRSSNPSQDALRKRYERLQRHTRRSPRLAHQAPISIPMLDFPDRTLPLTTPRLVKGSTSCSWLDGKFSLTLSKANQLVSQFVCRRYLPTPFVLGGADMLFPNFNSGIELLDFDPQQGWRKWIQVSTTSVNVLRGFCLLLTGSPFVCCLGRL